MKVLYNIKNVQFSKITATSDSGLPTYDSPIKVPGAVSLTLDNESTSETIYADGIAYYTSSGASSYSGTFENVHFTKEVLKAIFNYAEDTNGNLVEVDGGSNEFGMQFAVDSDEGDVYFTLFRCSATKPNANFQTKEASATINNESVDITISPITLSDGKNVVKAYADKSATNYSAYMDKITVPTFSEI